MSLSGRVGGNRSDILNPANLKSISSESSDGGLRAGSWGLDLNTTDASKLDVNCVDAEHLKVSADVDGSKHSGVWGGLLSVGLDLHASGDSSVGFSAREIRNVNESVVERSLDVADAEDVDRRLSRSRVWGSVVGDLLLLLLGISSLLALCLS